MRARNSHRYQPKPRGALIWVYEVQQKLYPTAAWKPFFYSCGREERAKITLDKCAARFSKTVEWRVERVQIDWWPGATRIDVYCPKCGAVTGHDQKAGDRDAIEERPATGPCRDCQPLPAGYQMLVEAVQSGKATLILGDEEHAEVFTPSNLCKMCGKNERATANYCEVCLVAGE